MSKTTLPEASLTPPDEGDPTPLPPMVRYMYGAVLPSETLRRVAGREFKDFQRLVEKLEANATNADFWKGIAAPR